MHKPDNPSTERARKTGYLYPIIIVITWLILFLRLSPFNPSMPESGLDPSWRQALEEATIGNLSFGRQVVFTLGPLSGAYTNEYHPKLFALNVVLIGLLSASYIRLLQEATRSAAQNPALRLILIGVLSFLSSMSDVFWYSFAAIGFFSAVVYWRPNRLASDLALGTVLAIVTLIKASLGVGAAIIWMGSVSESWFDRKLRPIVWGYPLACIVIWLACGQSFWSLPGFVRNTFYICAGYAEAMGTPVRSLTIVGLFLTALATQAVLFWYSLQRQQRLPGITISVTGYVLLGWSLFKAGFVRGHDSHVYTAVLGMLPMAAALWLYCRTALRTRFGRSLTYVSAASLVLCANSATTIYSNMNLARFLGYQLGLGANIVRANIRQISTADYEKRFEAQRAVIRRDYPVAGVSGDVDIYRAKQAVAFAYGLKWNPRPVFQSYAAFTPELIEMNRSHLIGEGSPMTILFDMTTIDNRYPTLDDGLSLLEILSRYKVISLTVDLAVLTRRANAIGYHFDNIVSTRQRFGEMIVLPKKTGKLVWVWIDFDKRLVGGLVTAFYKAPIVNVDVEFGDKTKKVFRIVPSMTRTGFLLSPLITHQAQFVFLNYEGASEAPEGARVVAMKIEADESERLVYKDEIDVRFAEVRFGGLDESKVWTKAEIAEKTKRYWATRWY